MMSGCTAITNPVADGIPVRLLPQELIGPPKTCWQSVPLHALRQPQPEVYRLAPGDVLGVYVDGFIGDRSQILAVHVPPNIQLRDQNRLPPSAGYPIPIENDGSIALSGIGKLKVDGMTIAEARDAIRGAYVKKELIKADAERMLVTLLYQRQIQVTVFRQEATLLSGVPEGQMPLSKRNTGHVVDLPAHQNDIITALARTGGLPDLDAYNDVIIYRNSGTGKPPTPEAIKELEKAKPGANLEAWSGEVIRIPLRLPAGAPLPFSPADVRLREGDILFLEARDEEVFFTAGLLPPGKHRLPRDHDLDVIEAVTMVRGPLYNGAFGGSNLSGTLIQPGLGNPSPSLLVVLRKVPGRGQVPIAVDLRDAMKYPQERIPIRPGDVLVLQEKPAEALARWATQTFFNFNIFWNVFNSRSAVGVFDFAAPDRLPGRVGVFNGVP
jgi:protein involved in polysaccharide export with SLBB domain